tara:strand:+ start:146 stop:1006 length:861 start_codon:yes stop_codon:yes gene_type:complete
MKTSTIPFLFFIKNSLVIVLIFFCCFDAIAHGDLMKRILSLTEEIKVHSDSAYLYFKRGKLYYQHNDYNESIEDFKRSKKLGFNSDEQYFLFAINYYKLNHFITSKRYIDKILKDQPDNVKAVKLVGHINFKRKKFKKAAEAYEKVILISKKTFPENYLDGSEAWYALRTENGSERATTLLIEGIEALGDNIVLYDKLISIYIDQGDYSTAIKFQKKVIDFSHRKERNYLKLANIQLLQENYTEVLKSLAIAKKYYSDLPSRIKNTKFMKEFYSKLELKETLVKKK